MTSTIGATAPPDQPGRLARRGRHAPGLAPRHHWDPVAGATSYDIEMDPDGDGVGASLKTDIGPRPTSGRTRRGSASARAPRTSSSACAPGSPTACRPSGPTPVSYDVTQLPASRPRLRRRRWSVRPAPDDRGPARAPPCRTSSSTGTRCRAQSSTRSGSPLTATSTTRSRGATVSALATRPPRRTATTTTTGRSAPSTRPTSRRRGPSTPNVFQRRWSAPADPGLPAGRYRLPRSATTSTSSGPRSSTRRGTSSTSAPTRTSPRHLRHVPHGQTTYTAGYRAGDDCMPSQGQMTYWRVKALDLPKRRRGHLLRHRPGRRQPGRAVRLRLRSGDSRVEPRQRRHRRRSDVALAARPGRRAVPGRRSRERQRDSGRRVSTSRCRGRPDRL